MAPASASVVFQMQLVRQDSAQCRTHGRNRRKAGYGAQFSSRKHKKSGMYRQILYLLKSSNAAAEDEAPKSISTQTSQNTNSLTPCQGPRQSSSRHNHLLQHLNDGFKAAASLYPGGEQCKTTDNHNKAFYIWTNLEFALCISFTKIMHNFAQEQVMIPHLCLSKQLNVLLLTYWFAQRPNIL